MLDRTTFSRRAACLSPLMLGVLASCRPQQSAETREGKLQVPSGPVLFWMGMSTAKDNPVVDEVMESFKQRMPSVAWTIEWEGSMDKLKASVAGGAPPDLMHTQSYVQTTWGVGGVVQPLDSHIRSSRNIKPDDVWPLKWQEVVFRGKTYALPYSLDTRVIYLNRAVMNEAGIDVARPPADWDSFTAAVTRVARADSAAGAITRLGFDPFLGSGGRARWLVPFWQLGGEFTTQDDTTVTIDNEKGIQALEFCLKLMNLQGGWPAVEALEKQAAPDALFANGKVGFLYETFSARESSFRRQWPDLEPGFMDYPLPKGGKPANYAGGWAICMPAGAKNPAGAFAVLEHLYSPDIDLKWASALLRVPVHMSVARSEEYIRRDPLLKATVDGMQYGRFVPSMPGAEAALPIYTGMVLDVISGKVSVREGLRQAQERLQLELDRFKGMG